MIYFLLTVNFLLMIALPLLLGIWLVRRYQVRWSLFFTGAAGFIVSQAGHLPFNQFVLNPWLSDYLAQGETAVRALVAGLLLGLSAGVFEEVTRYIFYTFKKDMRDWEKGLMFGTGWGGVEAIILGVLAATTLVNIYIYQSGLIETLVPADQAAAGAEAIAAGAQQIEELLAAPLYTFVLGAVERVFALILHLSLSILVLQAFVRHNIIWLFAAIGWHTVVNAAAVFGTLQGWDPLLIEAVLGAAALISFFIIRAFKPADEQAVARAES
jgi:uncharacterized membrane protein YhfC